MHKIRKRKYNLRAWLKKHGISQRILGELLGVSRPIIWQWVNDGLISPTWLRRICRLTKTEIDTKAKWTPFDLFALREKYNLTVADLARELQTSQPNVRNWEVAGTIPRTYLQKVRKAKERCRCRHNREHRQTKK